MLFPSLESLIKGSRSRYSLVIAVARRAREIVEEAEAKGIKLEDKPVNIAVQELAEGKYDFKEPVDTDDDNQP